MEVFTPYSKGYIKTQVNMWTLLSFLVLLCFSVCVWGSAPQAQFGVALPIAEVGCQPFPCWLVRHVRFTFLTIAECYTFKADLNTLSDPVVWGVLKTYSIVFVNIKHLQLKPTIANESKLTWKHHVWNQMCLCSTNVCHAKWTNVCN